MKKTIIIFLSVIFIAGFIIIPVITEQLVDANPRKKVHFTQTLTSSQDPGIGHEEHQLAIILSPNKSTLYDGSLTYTASEPVQIVVLHEISKNDVKNQPTWTVDEKTFYGITLVEPKSNAGSFEFTGAAVALHTENSKPFTATVSVDGWVRGQPPEVIMQKIEVQKEDPILKLSRANVPAKIPMHIGSYDENPLYYIITDTNNQTLAKQISEKQNWQVEVAPPLSNAPKTALGTVYLFTNGVDGEGIHGYQNEVFSSTPQQTDKYSALRLVTNVTWKKGQNANVLDSEDKILEAEKSGRIELKQTDVIINMPQIIWPGGQMIVRENATLAHDMQYEGGQILEIDKEKMTVTFIAHRGWGPDGKTIYYIVTDATPTGPAQLMGVSDSPILANMIANSAAVDLFQFKNGIKGSGPLGFQPGIASSAPDDENYSPMWRIFLIEWKNPEKAVILETKSDIEKFQSDGLITVSLARPLNSDHIVNCPFIDPFQ